MMHSPDIPSLFYNSLKKHSNSLTFVLQFNTVFQASILLPLFGTPNKIISLNV